MTVDTAATPSLPLGPIHLLAAERVEQGWAQGKMEDNAGNVCLTGAFKICELVPGDWLLARAVYRERKHDEDWNDADGRTQAEVAGYLRSTEVTDADLAATFGPQWEAIVALVRRAAVLTAQEVSSLDAAWDAARDAARDAAWFAAWDAARDAARDAAGEAARALVVRDLIGQHGLAQAHYDILARPWVTAIGRVHPDDAVVTT